MGEEIANGALPFDPAEYEARREAARDILEMHGLDALVLTAPASLVHLSGVSGVAGGVVVTADAVLTIVPDAQLGRAMRLGHGAVAAHDGRAPDGFWRALAGMLGPGKAVGVEANHLTMVAADMMSHHLAPRKGIDVAPAIRSQRAVRSPAEIALLRRLAGVAGCGMAALGQAALAGIREIDAARAGEAAMAEELARAFPALPAGESRAFVAAGRETDTGLPCPTGRRIAASDALALTCRAVLAGHAIAVGRMAMVGAETGGWQTAEAARDAGLAAIRPGATADAVEAAVDAALAGRDGIGRVAAPALMLGGGIVPEKVPETGLEVGMVLTLAPHLRLGAAGGWLCTDPVLVTEAGAESLAE